MDKATDLNLNFALNLYKNRSLTDSISIATEELQYKVMSIQNYREAVNNSDLVDQRKSRNDFEFEEEYPDHPLAGKNRDRRIIAGDFFRFLSGAVELSQIPTDTIKILEQSLYDCCAAVRLSVIQALGRWRSKDCFLSDEYNYL